MKEQSASQPASAPASVPAPVQRNYDEVYKNYLICLLHTDNNKSLFAY